MKILDCTMRDGGYYNGWWFDIDFTREYLQACCLAQVDVVEIGFRFKNYDGLGRYASSKIASLKSLGVQHYPFKVAIMLNVSDFVTKEGGVNRYLDEVCPGSDEDVASIVRLAANMDQLEIASEIAINLKSKGYLVCLNVMRCSSLSDSDFQTIARSIASVDILYLADSFGSCEPANVTASFERIGQYVGNIELGFHGHDNKGLVHANVKAAVTGGCTWIDGTFAGMGRGPGNAKTEILAVEKTNDLDLGSLAGIQQFLNVRMYGLLAKYLWGSNCVYAWGGKNGIHPTPLQKALDESRDGTRNLAASLERVSVKTQPRTPKASRRSIPLNNKYQGRRGIYVFPGINGVTEYAGEVKYLREKGLLVCCLNLPTSEEDLGLIDLVVLANSKRVETSSAASTCLEKIGSAEVIYDSSDLDLNGFIESLGNSTDMLAFDSEQFCLDQGKSRVLDFRSTLEFFLMVAWFLSWDDIYFGGFEDIPFQLDGNYSQISAVFDSYPSIACYSMHSDHLPLPEKSIFRLL